jgi:hypothetical protein
MTLQPIGPRRWRESLFPLGRIMLAVLLTGAPAIYYIAYLPARAVRKGHILRPPWARR